MTRVGGTARLQSAAPTTHTRSVSRSRRADNPDRGDEGARRRQEGKKGLLDSRLRAGASPSALRVRGLRQAGHLDAHRAPHLHPRLPITPTASSSRPGGWSPEQPPSSAPTYQLLGHRRDTESSPAAAAPPTPASALRPGPTELRSGRSPTCSPRPLEHRDIKY